MIYLLDSDTAILMMRGIHIVKPKSARQMVLQEMGRRIITHCRAQSGKGNVVGLSAITVAELEYGASGADDPGAERSRMKGALHAFMTFDFDADLSPRQYGQVRFTLETAGQTIGPNDLLIAAHALTLGAVLVTNNTREFKRVTGLKCENWTIA